MSDVQKGPARVLEECIELQRRKGSDYQSKSSSVVQADYYPRGIESLMDIIHAKYLRAVSVSEKMKTEAETEFESLEDSFKDLINYASFAVAWIRGEIDGQNPESGLFSNKSPTPKSNIHAWISPPPDFTEAPQTRMIPETPVFYGGNDGSGFGLISYTDIDGVIGKTFLPEEKENDADDTDNSTETQG